MKIGIIGSGQLGKELYIRLRGNGNTTCLYSRSCGFDAKRVDIAREIVSSNHVIINCAAMTDVDGCEKDHAAAINANISLPQNLSILCEEYGGMFVHISTDFVYGSNDVGTALTETSPCSPVNFYGETKLVADNYIQNNAKKYLILRPSWLFGPCGNNNFIFKMMNKLMPKSSSSSNSYLSNLSEPVKVVNDQYGVPTSTSLIADIIKLWIDGRISDGVYNVRNEIDGDGCPTKYHVACFIKECLKSKMEITPVFSSDFTMPARRQKNSMLSIKKLQDELLRTSIESPIKITRSSLNNQCWKTMVNNYLMNALGKV